MAPAVYPSSAGTGMPEAMSGWNGSRAVSARPVDRRAPVMVVADPIGQHRPHRSSHPSGTGIASRIRHRPATSRQPGIGASAKDYSLSRER